MASSSPSAAPEPSLRVATFPRRLNALSADTVILILFSIIVFWLLSSGEDSPALRLTLGFLWWGTLLLYEPLMVAWCGGTLGHRLLNLKVVDDRTGGNPGLAKALARFLVKALLGVFSFFSMSVSRRHQAIHDMMTSSTVQIREPARAAPHHYVVVRRPYPPSGSA